MLKKINFDDKAFLSIVDRYYDREVNNQLNILITLKTFCFFEFHLKKNFKIHDELFKRITDFYDKLKDYSDDFQDTIKIISENSERILYLISIEKIVFS